MINIDAIIDSMEWSLDADERADMRRLCQATLAAAAERRIEAVAWICPVDLGALVNGRTGAATVRRENSPYPTPRIALYTRPQPAPAMTQAELDVIANLIKLARVVTLAMDDSEERCGDEGRVHLINSGNFDGICTALDELDALPDDKPGYTLGPAGKAEWALRSLLPTAPSPN
ncbi:hypothetical protein [Chromobacterium piscinae]|uniref:hypothetical protein n=1 Tax=Chromobacterium piscinae TaxID=686831 RepID=UPI003F7EA361